MKFDYTKRAEEMALSLVLSDWDRDYSFDRIIGDIKRENGVIATVCGDFEDMPTAVLVDFIHDLVDNFKTMAEAAIDSVEHPED